jgi:hypothetical protein
MEPFMERQTSKPLQPPSAEPAHAKKGPTPIDPNDFGKVGGGLPKGGFPNDPVIERSPGTKTRW